MPVTNKEVDAIVAKAADEQLAGRLDSAERLCRQALAIDGDSISAKFVLGVALARKGDAHGAIAMLADVLLSEPDSYEALISQSNLLSKTGDAAGALALATRARDVRPGEAQAHFLVGKCLLALRRLTDAESSFRFAIALKPRFARAHHNLGQTLHLQGRYGDAEKAFRQSAALAPTIENRLEHGKTLLTLCEYERARQCALGCLAMDPNSVVAHLLLCGASAGLGCNKEAEEHLRAATLLDKDGRHSYQIGVMQRPLGLIQEAEVSFRLAITHEPDSVWPYKALFYNQKVSEDDRPMVDRLQRIVEGRNTGPTELMTAHYGLGKALEDLHDYQASMRHYDEANRIARQIKLGAAPLDRGRYIAGIDKLIELGNELDQAAAVGTQSDSEVPIFIVGMMRSGTTLAEQILSSHSQVQAAGELSFWTRNWHRVSADVPDSSEQVATEYLELLRTVGPTSARVTDKMPGNYRFAGVIRHALPNARFIHMRRHPIDTCLSIWATTNDFPNEGGHDKSDIVFVYEQYLRMMRHWRGALPDERLLEVDYEQLVADRESVTRRMVQFCGLPWEDTCLRPEDNERIVMTPSVRQVRQPVYQTSIDRWRRFEPWLGAFSELAESAH